MNTNTRAASQLRTTLDVGAALTISTALIALDVVETMVFMEGLEVASVRGGLDGHETRHDAAVAKATALGAPLALVYLLARDSHDGFAVNATEYALGDMWKAAV